ncbi:hypothetical protein O6H91_07G059400 [Diphasiastrum complanatum]|uniref:Uncharacterized protein n=1 Tax=Diphasiastrum complanatum TaxID=34168 RepID=A0ACC2D5V9_DIPCM|nr:hypothetical protein O6H91_07G059400 [Diphasiastrum complanatum]
METGFHGNVPMLKSRSDASHVVFRRRELSPSSMRVNSFRTTIRSLQLDHSQSFWSLLSWFVGLTLLMVVPTFRLLYVKATDDKPQHQLVFQPLVVSVGVWTSIVSFLFLRHAIRQHGLRGVLFLDSIAEEAVEVRKDYDIAIEQGATLLAKIFLPAFALFLVQKTWFFTHIKLQPLPFGFNSQVADLAVVIGASTFSWIFQTTTYLYTCVLFWTVCFLQELKMKQFKESLGKRLSPELYYHQYVKILQGLQTTSRRFRQFLALTGAIIVFGALASMYAIVGARRTGFNIFMAGELLVLNMVNLTGIGLCLRSASRLAHFHRRIVKAACSMHALGTFSSAIQPATPCLRADLSVDIVQRLEMLISTQDAWCRRAALVSFLSSTNAGISVYGFVLDRFFVHTSIGALLTTTWFILGQSLG